MNSVVDTFHSLFLAPFEYDFMRNALLSCVCLSLSACPMGVILVLRRMSLMGDALSHAILPGVAIGYILMGLSLPAMSIGGLAVGLLVALAAGLTSRATILREDASFAGFFLISLALGVLLISVRSSSVDLMHVLFGSALSVDKPSLYLIGGITTVTMITLAAIYRPLLIECFDPIFFRSVSGRGSLHHGAIIVLVVLNLVGSFQALGTLLSLGMMMLPAISARLWARHVMGQFVMSCIFGIISGYAGLVLSFHYNLPSGPTIVLMAGVIYIISLLLGYNGSVYHQWKRRA
jgi:zinc/manganese transport system permease protein